jgi:hypothetical protein
MAGYNRIESLTTVGEAISLLTTLVERHAQVRRDLTLADEAFADPEDIVAHGEVGPLRVAFGRDSAQRESSLAVWYNREQPPINLELGPSGTLRLIEYQEDHAAIFNARCRARFQAVQADGRLLAVLKDAARDLTLRALADLF